MWLVVVASLALAGSLADAAEEARIESIRLIQTIPAPVLAVVSPRFLPETHL